MAEATTGGPAPYAKGSDTLLCPVCALYNDSDALRCDQCGTTLQEGPRAWSPRPKDIVPCGRCPAFNQPDAVYCDQCGGRLPHSAYEAAKAAQQAATSSSGRQPMTPAAERAVELLARANDVPADVLKAAVADALNMPAVSGNAGKPATSSSGRQAMTPSERTEYIRRRNNEAAERAALDVPPPTGRGRDADLAAAIDHFDAMHALWERFDEGLRRAQAQAGQIPSAQDAVVLADLQRRTDTAWASREKARHHRDALEELDRYMPPPGEGEW